jgi:hypothetical protein
LQGLRPPSFERPSGGIMKHTGTPGPKTPVGGHRWGHAQEDHILDPYKRPQKLEEPTICPQCGAVYQAGRWHWATRPKSAHETVCQACHRINDQYPAGIVTLVGALTVQQKADMINLARHQEADEKAEHPLNRIIDIEEGLDQIVINTTDIHLPRRIGEAIKRAFHGKLERHFDEHGYFVRVNWTHGAPT